MPTTSPDHRANDQLEHALLAAWSVQADVGMCAVDENQQVVMLNAAACNMLGVSGLDVLGRPFVQLLTRINLAPDIMQWLDSPGNSSERHASWVRQGTPVDLLFKITTLALPSAAFQRPDVPATAHFKMIAITDISSLLAAQRQVHSETYRRQWQALNAGVVISDARAPDMPIVYVNPMFEQMSGYAASEVLGRNCRFLQGDEPLQSGLETIRAAIRNQSNGYARLRNYRKDGTVFINELFVSPVKDDSGTVTHFVGIQHVLTDLAEAAPSDTANPSEAA